MRILVAEDDCQLRGRLVAALGRAHYQADAAGDGIEAEFLGATESYDAVILDRGLPGMDGIDILRSWRSADLQMPVILLTARDTWRERVEGLRSGADDYLGKPFMQEELLARLEAVIRRAKGRARPTIEIGEVEIDPGLRVVRHRGEDVALTSLEFRALSYLGLNAGRVVPQDELISHVYSQDAELGSNVVEVVVSRIRKKIHPGIIVTKRGHGYVVPQGG